MSVTLHTTHGPLKLEIFCEAVPKTATNFLALCASSYYDATPFHRNIAGFIVQGGDPTGKGKGGASIYNAANGLGSVDGKFEDEIRPGLRHNARGVVSMANKGPSGEDGGGGTNGSQFFVTYAAAGHLDGKNTVFGKVIDGAETTLSKMERVEVDKKYRPKEPFLIERVTIHANPLANQ